jgi:hypothetical protein
MLVVTNRFTGHGTRCGAALYQPHTIGKRTLRGKSHARESPANAQKTLSARWAAPRRRDFDGDVSVRAAPNG